MSSYPGTPKMYEVRVLSSEKDCAYILRTFDIEKARRFMLIEVEELDDRDRDICPMKRIFEGEEYRICLYMTGEPIV